MKHSKVFVNKDGENFLISYSGNEDIKKDGFIMHYTGYDNGIGNQIEDYKHFGQFNEVMGKPALRNLLDIEHDKYRNPITSGFAYMNAIDVVNFYGRLIQEGYKIDYNDRINKFGFKIEKI